ncbi:serine/threonine-protein kinase [Rivibacter subsaxonicus]|uniref:Serine/threonine protein kinase n=1 Tax=Rivibacter subsaxonicus TaxID=457575 RepID=A0A4Q7VNP0_9BURK|nr:serine/threonine-protein kinase [Rivibacter subsaxonicus]RZT98006.1 serine/threonine protein kinase [Rivibacter subsaxonicus]
MAPIGPQDWQRLSQLYDEALDLADEQRPAWLEALREAGDPMLQRLLQMLEARRAAEDEEFLDALPPTTAPAAGTPQAGTRIGPYRIERPLGSGGMAEVWLARRDDGGPQRAVALKLLHRWRAGPAFAPRFERERDILAGLNHPRIASLFDAGTSAEGWPYLALEFVDGEPITEHADRLRLGLRGRIALFRQVLLAMQHAHAHLVLHRDLKPANILVTGDGWVKLLDFGIAKLLAAEQSQTDDTELTREAGRPLTPRYASPEQILGRPLSTASDVYSLGVVLYELLCGHEPCEPGSTLPGALERAIVEIEPRPASQRVDATVAALRGSEPRALRRALASELDALLGKALAKDPARRYGSVDLLLADVDRWLAGEPVQARAPSAWWRAAKFAGRHRVGVALGSAALAGMVVLTTVALVQAQRARSEAATALAARSFLLDLFRWADPQTNRGRELSARELLDTGRRQAAALQGQAELQLDLLGGIGDVQLFIGDYENAARAQQEVLRLRQRDGDRRGAAIAQLELADNVYRQGGYAEAARLVADAASAAEADDHELQFRIAEQRGWLALHSGQSPAAQAQFEQALVHARVAFGEASLPAIDALRGLLNAVADRGRYEEALALVERARVLVERAPDMTPRDRLGNDYDRVNVLYRWGRFRDAAAAAADSEPRCAEQLGAADETCVLQLQLQLQSMLSMDDRSGLQGRLPALIGVLDRLPAGRRSAEGLIVAVHSLIGAGQVERHPELVERLARQAEAASGERLPRALAERSALVMAELELRRGKADEARRWLSSFALQQPAQAPAPRQQAHAGLVDAWVWRAAGDKVRAEQALLRAYRDYADLLGAEHPQTLSVSLNLADLLRAQGRTAEGLALVDAALPGLRVAWGADSPAFRRAARLQSELRDATGGIAKNAVSTPEFFN